MSQQSWNHIINEVIPRMNAKFVPSFLVNYAELAFETHLWGGGIFIVRARNMNAIADSQHHNIFKAYSANRTRQSSKGEAESIHAGTSAYGPIFIFSWLPDRKNGLPDEPQQ